MIRVMTLINNTHTPLDGLYIHGQDAETFLQGQLTCDISKVTETLFQPTACCNIQGRIIALFFIIRWKTGYLLVFPTPILKNALKHFKKYAVFSRITFEYPVQENNEPMVYGGFSQKPEQCDDIKPCVGLGGLFIGCFPTQTENSKKIFNNALNNATWHQQLLSHKFPIIHPETQALFLPHRIGLQYFQGILDFKKGCYLGQEIIARTHFKAKQKHTVCLCKITNMNDNSLLPGDSIFDKTGQNNIGDVIDMAESSTQENQFYTLIALLSDAITDLPDHIVLINIA